MAKIRKEFIDDLTGLFNRRYLFIQAPRKLKDAEDNGIPSSIVFIDLDHFKNVNDTYSHTRGDVVLKEFATFLKTLLRTDDTVFRYGGDEFVCVLPNANYEQAKRISQRFIEECRNKEFAQIRLTMSIGIASCPENAGDWQTLFEIADRNLFSAKRHGRDRISILEKGKKELIIPTEEIIGRDEDITKIKEFISPIFSGNGGAVCISGEVGVGKTRLVRECVKHFQLWDIRILESSLSATTNSIPYYPFRDIIRTVINKEGKGSIKEIAMAYQIELVKIIPEISGKSSEVEKNIFMLDKFRLFEGVRRFLALQASKLPLFVCLDNIHWIDKGSLELLHYLIRALRKSPIFFFLIYRVEEIKDSFFQSVLQLMGREGLYEKINLETLETADIAQMLSLIIDASPPLELTEYIFKKTRGNPFFIGELMKSLETSRALIWDKDKWIFDESKKVAIPYSVAGVVDRKLVMLNNEAQGLLEYAAVIGREFDFTFLRDITKMNEGHLFDLIDDILEVRLLKESGGERYCFSENIIREIIYNQISGAELRRYHQIVGERLLSIYKDRIKEVVEELSHHFYISGDRKKAIKYSMIAADRAKSSYANQDAIRFYTWVIESLRHEAIIGRELEEIECLRKRAIVSNLVGKNEDAVMDLKEAIKKSKKMGDEGKEADCLIAFSKVYQDMAQCNKAAKKAGVALEIYRELDNKKGVADSLNNIGVVYEIIGDYTTSLEFYQRSLKTTKEIVDRRGEAASFYNIGVIYKNLGEYTTSLKYYQDSLNIRKEIGDHRGEAASLKDIGIVYELLGDYSTSLEFYQDSLKIVEVIGNRKGEAACFNNIGIIYYYLGGYITSLEFYQRSLKIREEIGERRGQATSFNNIGIIYNNLGEYTTSLEFYQRSLRIREEIGDRKGEAASLNNIGIIYNNLGEYTTSLEFYQRSLKIREEIGDRRGEALSLNNIGIIYNNLGEYTTSLEFHQRSFKIKKKIADCWGEVGSLLSLGDTYFEKGDLSVAGKYYNKAHLLARKIKSKLFLAYAFLGLTSLYLTKSNLAEAKKRLNQTLSLADELGSKEIKAKALCLSGRLYTKQKKWDKAKSSFKESISIGEELKRKFDIAQVYYYQGLMFKEADDKTSAKKSFTRAMKIFKKLGAKGWIEKVPRGLGDKGTKGRISNDK
ncbi:tetratricopeptide repeat protein [candidate division WOR-3 bacterium]|nr:tetratricopeptide repeat protein [candidate division WOR-3 bacterium]